MAFLMDRRSTFLLRPSGFAAGSNGSISALRRRQMAQMGSSFIPPPYSMRSQTGPKVDAR